MAVKIEKEVGHRRAFDPALVAEEDGLVEAALAGGLEGGDVVPIIQRFEVAVDGAVGADRRGEAVSLLVTGGWDRGRFLEKKESAWLGDGVARAAVSGGEEDAKASVGECGGETAQS